MKITKNRLKALEKKARIRPASCYGTTTNEIMENGRKSAGSAMMGPKINPNVTRIRREKQIPQKKNPTEGKQKGGRKRLRRRQQQQQITQESPPGEILLGYLNGKKNKIQRYARQLQSTTRYTRRKKKRIHMDRKMSGRGQKPKSSFLLDSYEQGCIHQGRCAWARGEDTHAREIHSPSPKFAKPTTKANELVWKEIRVRRCVQRVPYTAVLRGERMSIY